MTWPCGSRIGETASATSTRVPSLRSRVVSSRSTRCPRCIRSRMPRNSSPRSGGASRVTDFPIASSGAYTRAARPRPPNPVGRVLDEVLQRQRPAVLLRESPLAIAYVYREADDSDDRALWVQQRLHARIIEAVGQADLVGERLARERL